MKLSEFVRLRNDLVDHLDNVFGRDMSSSEIVEYLFESDVLDVAQLELFLKEAK